MRNIPKFLEVMLPERLSRLPPPIDIDGFCCGKYVSPTPMRLADFDFDLPPELIAQYPLGRRDQSRLLVLDRSDSSIQHLRFDDVRRFLKPEDALVVNRTRVVHARLRGRKAETGAEIELLMIRQQEGGRWLALGRPGRRLSPNTVVEFAGGRFRGTIVDKVEGGRLLVSFAVGDTDRLIEEAGEVPLPPYIRRRPNAEDAVRYQTVFARDHGAIAAPTAGLHFTSDLLGSIEASGTAVASILLHVGPGTFEPVRSEELGQNSLEPEYYEVDRGTAAELRKRRRIGGRLVAVGTTVVRTLETVVGQNGEIRSGRGWSGKFIFPPYEFKAIDALLTNFHLPKSSLLLLVAAFAGRNLVIEAYRAAVAERYRFYSYGDAMLIL